jgi:ribosomal protein S18 acetylase RimI-like enzyme
MSQQSYLIDTNILIGLEDDHQVEPMYARFLNLASSHKVNVFVHEASVADIDRDKDDKRRRISLSKLAKYPILKGQRGLEVEELSCRYGKLNKPNDITDASLLHALEAGAVDFLVTQDKGLHERAQSHSSELGRRVLFLSDATGLLAQTYEPKEVPIRLIAEVKAHEINHKDTFFDSLRERYTKFDRWWQEQCVKERRSCWVIYDDQRLAGLIVRKDETPGNTDAVSPANRIMKICTFKVAPESRGIKLGELLLKQALWYAQTNAYDLVYLTTFEEQASLRDLLEFYGFKHQGVINGGELIYERRFSRDPIVRLENYSDFDLARENYPRFLLDAQTRGFGVPIKEDYHDSLYPDLMDLRQPDLFDGAMRLPITTRPGNTIRKVYLCRAQSRLGPPGSLLFFYKGKSKALPSQAMTALGILESVRSASSTRELMQMTGGRSVYSEEQLARWDASQAHPVKVINFLLLHYIKPPVSLGELKRLGIIKENVPQSIYELTGKEISDLVARSNLEFQV